MATAGSVPKTNSRMISAPMPPISVSVRTEGPFELPLSAALRIGSLPVRWPTAPAGSAARSAARAALSCVSKVNPGVPGLKISAKVVCPSFETYMRLPVEK